MRRTTSLTANGGGFEVTIDFQQDDELTQLQSLQHQINRKSSSGHDGVGDALAKQQSFGNFFLGRLSPIRTSSGGLKAQSDAMPDLVAKNKMVNDYIMQNTA
jgi:hypothetical protein